MAASRETVVDTFRIPDALWGRIEPLMPRARRSRKGGRPPIPDDVRYRPKWQIGLELLARAEHNGWRFDWLTFDEGYGGRSASRGRPARRPCGR